MSIIARQLKTIADADAELAKLESAQIDRTNAAMEAALSNLLRDLRGKFADRLQANIIGRDRAILLANDLRDALNVFSPNSPRTQALLRDFEQITIAADRVGKTLADALISPYEPTIASTVDLSLDVVAAVAKQGYDRLLARGAEFANNASTAIQQGILQGWGVSKIATVVKAVGGVTRSAAERIVRTESNRAAISAVKERYRANDISQVIWIATQDKRTCPKCAARAGGIYEMDKVTVPLHPNDRCYLSPYKQSWADAGLIDLDWMANHHEQAVKLAGKADNSASPWEVGGKPSKIEQPAKVREAVKELPKAKEAVKAKDVTAKSNAKEPAKPEKSTKARKPAKEPSKYEFTPLEYKFSRENDANSLGISDGTTQEYKFIKNKNTWTAKLSTPDIVLNGIVDTDPYPPRSVSIPAFMQKELQKLLENKSPTDTDIHSVLSHIPGSTAYNTRIKSINDIVANFENQVNSIPVGQTKKTQDIAKDFLSNLINMNSRDIASKRAGIDVFDMNDGAPLLNKKAQGKKLINQAIDFHQLIDKDLGIKLIIQTPDTRANAVFLKNTIHLDRDELAGDKKTTLWHEMAHFTEFVDPETGKKAVEWVAGKATGKQQLLSKLTGNTGYDESEKALPDDFIHPYVGKVYEGFDITEVHSMGLQYFAEPDKLIELYRTAPDHFNLMIEYIKK